MKSFKILLITAVVILLGSLKLDAQIQYEPKINPLALILSGDFVVGCEFILSDKLGVEPVVDFGKSNIGLSGVADEVSFTGFGVRAIGKYYFNPNRGADKFYVGPYFKYKGGVGKDDISDTNYVRTRLAAGLALGYKVLSKSGIAFEVGLGAGRAFTDKFKNSDDDTEVNVTDVINLDLLGRLAIGYRFGGTSSSGSSRKR